MLKTIHIEIKPADVMLVSFPRSGNTWVRAILVNLIIFRDKSAKTKVDYNTIRKTIFYDKRCEMFNGNNENLYDLRLSVFPRIIKTHNPFLKEYGRSIYIIRDPRDIVISYYYFLKYHKKREIPSFVEFMRNTIIDWCEHINSWNGRWDILLQYEQLKKNTHREISRILDFLNINIDREIIDLAIKRSSIEKMKELELLYRKQKGYDITNYNSFNIRKAEIGEWKKYFKEEDIAFYKKQIRKHKLNSLMKKLNYI